MHRLDSTAAAAHTRLTLSPALSTLYSTAYANLGVRAAGRPSDVAVHTYGSFFVAPTSFCQVIYSFRGKVLSLLHLPKTFIRAGPREYIYL
jgi:hypothetical protein